jgi:hypothetical protein
VAAYVGAQELFKGVNAAAGGLAAGLDKTIQQTALGFMQGTMTNMITSTINSVTYSSEGGFGFDSGAFGKSVQAGLVSGAVQAAQTIMGGLINTGIEGLTAVFRRLSNDVLRMPFRDRPDGQDNARSKEALIYSTENKSVLL